MVSKSKKMKTSLKILVLDAVIARLEDKSEQYGDEVNLVYHHTSGICRLYYEEMCKQKLELLYLGDFEKFMKSNRPTLRNKWREFADPTRLKSPWWWSSHLVEPRVKFLKALRESLIKK